MSLPIRVLRALGGRIRAAGARHRGQPDHCAVFAAFAASMAHFVEGAAAPVIRQPALRQGASFRPKPRRSQ